MRDDDYEGATNYGAGIYTDYGEKDMVHSPVPVTLFAERGKEGRVPLLSVQALLQGLES